MVMLAEPLNLSPSKYDDNLLFFISISLTGSGNHDDDQSTCWKVIMSLLPRLVVFTQAGVAEETIKTGVGTNNCHRTI